jgi:hypothetical protein
LEDRTVPYYSPIGATEFLLNQTTLNAQQNVQVSMDSTGNFVAAWASVDGGGNSDIYARRYDAAGNALGNEFLVNTYTTNNQTLPDVAVAPNGNFVITWSSTGQDGSEEGVYAQRYNSAGVAQGAEFRVNTYTTYSQTDSAIAMDSSGNFTIVWQSGSAADNPSPAPQDGSSYGVYFRRYNSAGTALSGEVRANGTTTSFQGTPSIAMDNSGNFIVAWTYVTVDLFLNTNAEVYARRFSNSGTALSSEFRVNQSTTREQFFPEVAMDNVGNFVVTWASNHDDGVTLRTNTFARRYNNANTPVAQGGEFRINTYTSGEQFLHSVAMDGAGNFVVAWSSGVSPSVGNPSLEQDGSLYGVYAQRFTSAGATSGSEFRVNNYTTGNQFFPSVAMNRTTGNLVISWGSAGQDGSSYGNYARRYQQNQAPTANAGSPYTISEGNSLVLNASASSDPEGQPLTYIWDVNGDNVFGDAIGVNPTLTWAQLNALGITDGPTTRNVRVQVNDGYTGGVVTSANVLLTVNNAPPTAGIIVPTGGVRGETLSFTLLASDPSPVDQASLFSFLVDWTNDGVYDSLIFNVNSPVVVTHVYDQAGTYAVRVQATDKDGGIGLPPTIQNVTVSEYALRPNGGLVDLVWGGTPDADFIEFGQPGPNQVSIYPFGGDPMDGVTVSGVTGIIRAFGWGGDDLMMFNNSRSGEMFGGSGFDGLVLNSNVVGTYLIEGGDDADRLYIFNVAVGSNTTLSGGNGTDLILNASESTAGVTMLGGNDTDAIGGGPGNDHIDGGDGDDILIGGWRTVDGNDTIIGGEGNDFIVGGYGADSISGGNGQDLIIAGAVSVDFFALPDPEAPAIFNIPGLWFNTSESVATRINRLTGVLPTGLPPEYDPYILNPGTIVFDDTSVDTIFGNADEDWLLYDFTMDIASDYNAGVDFRTNI